ncbi:hypothetical protein ACFOYW_10055 [Gryllotalpicola reticulitermitis]|uniref:Uncharacterized protein n=1 Tax=Gryllotalpicola reticulitermitis TaxID=1184153 RepID=A0ABV8Q8F8_9MICO
MTERQQRALRGIAAAALAVFVAAWFHIAAGGVAPTPLAMLASFLLASPASVLIAGRRLRLWRTVVIVALNQFAFHALFGLGQPSSVRFSGGGDMAGMPGMRIDVTGGAASVSYAASAMWAGHAIAGLLTIGAICFGERVLRRMLELASRFIIRALRLAQVRAFPPLRLAAPAFASPFGLQRILSRAIRRRGPPKAIGYSF